jgi:uncharacterized protein YcnI
MKPLSWLGRVGVGGALAVVAVLGFAGVAGAHVTVDPSTAPKGGEVTLGFRVPNEEPAATTVQLQVVFPSDHPILGVDPEPTPGWHVAVTTSPLNPPVQTDDGPVTSYVSQIVWSGGSIPVGDFQEFHILAQQLPTNTDSVTFKAVQTYSNGDVVRWIEIAQPGQPEPEHPAPVLTLTAPESLAHAPSSSSSSSDTAGTVGLILGAIGAAAGITALALVVARRRGTHA